jgi:hypothetical protein
MPLTLTAVAPPAPPAVYQSFILLSLSSIKLLTFGITPAYPSCLSLRASDPSPSLLPASILRMHKIVVACCYHTLTAAAAPAAF